MVGALLVAASAGAVLAAHLRATAEPDTHYLVATRVIAPGTRIDDRATALTLFGSAPVALDPPLDARAIPAGELDGLVGRVVAAAMERGDLLQRSAMVDRGAHPDAHAVSFAVPRADALGGDLAPGQHVDVLATYGHATDAYTAFVVRGVPVVAVREESRSLAAGDVVVTVAVAGLEDVQALGHAVRTAGILISRPTVGEPVAAPEPYRPPRPRDIEGPAVEPPADATGAPPADAGWPPAWWSALAPETWTEGGDGMDAEGQP